MSATVTVLVVISLQQGLFALLWAMLGLMGMSRRQSVHWALAAALVSASLLLVALRDELGPWLGYWVAPMLTLAGFVLLRRGVREFAHRGPGDAEPIIVALAAAPALAAALIWGEAWTQVTVASAALGLPLMSAAKAILRHLRGEFGAALAVACAAPFLLIGALFVWRALGAALWPETVGLSLHAVNSANLASVLGFMVAGMALNFGLLGLVLSRMVRRLQHLSEHDGLTGLLNRRAIEGRLLAEARRLARYPQPYSVLSIDVDDFKSINDRFGHPAGDTVLRAIGQILRQVGRTIDLPARTGGEEFWLVMPATGLAGALQVAERLLAAVREMRVPGPRGEISLSVSIGVAVAEQAAEPVDQLLQRLDAALYRAKQSGRDRVEVAPPPGAVPTAQAPA